MSLRLELSRRAVLQATTLNAFVRGPGVTGSPGRGPRQSFRERSTLRQKEGTACDLRSMTWQARLGPTFEVSVGTCVITRSTMKSCLPCLPHIHIYTRFPFGMCVR